MLSNFQHRISSCDELSLQTLKYVLKDDPQYKILATGQDDFTKFFSLKTSSVKALEEMIKERESE
ncbi:MAG: hypothetical protein ACRCXC_13285 [Legionella sp.]